MTKRLYKKGDKVTVTFTVIKDQHSYEKHVYTQSPVKEQPLYRSAKMLDAGVLEPVPETPYVPKPGDRFKLLTNSSGRIGLDIARCVFSDDHTVLYEYEGPPHIRHHLNTGTKFYTFIKVDE